ncbi:MAG: carboxymuconolactone decarboxylase family protein [Actinomycetota bacterium]|nr:MAG: carboxymuconolactone decarboxylase family protein [Actinomycetota bacterium]
MTTFPAPDTFPNHTSLRRRTSRDTEGDASRVLGKLEATGQDLTISRLVANAGQVLRPFMLMSSALLVQATLPSSVREVVILRIAQQQQTSYEWAEHVPMALRAGVTQQQIDAIEAGQVDEQLFSADELLAVGIAERLLAGGGVPPEDFAAARERWTDDGALELVLSVGWWGGLVPVVIRALGLVDADRDPSVGLTAPERSA